MVSSAAASLPLPTSRLAALSAAWSIAPEAETPCPAWPCRPRSWNRVCRPVPFTFNDAEAGALSAGNAVRSRAAEAMAPVGSATPLSVAISTKRTR
ncbi:hypothetical protein D3C81_1579990 [compost metagenome]